MPSKRDANSSKNSKDVYGAVGKTNVLMFDPETLVIVEDKKDLLFDKRYDLEMNENMIKNVMELSVFEPIIVRKNPENGDIEVVDGRQRVRWAREANKRLAKKGLETIAVPAVVKRGSDELLFSILVSANEIRTADTPSVRAEKMQKLIDMGKTEDGLCVIFGCSKATVKNTLAILECTAVARKAADDGKLNVSHLYVLSKLPPEEQKAKVAAILSSVNTDDKPRQRSQKINEIVKGPKKERLTRPSKDVLYCRKYIEETEAIDDSAREVALATLDWVLGKETLNKFMAKPLRAKSMGVTRIEDAATVAVREDAVAEEE